MDRFSARRLNDSPELPRVLDGRHPGCALQRQLCLTEVIEDTPLGLLDSDGNFYPRFLVSQYFGNSHAATGSGRKRHRLILENGLTFIVVRKGCC